MPEFWRLGSTLFFPPFVPRVPPTILISTSRGSCSSVRRPRRTITILIARLLNYSPFCVFRGQGFEG